MEHAYAITVHKSQGSEFEAVIMPLMSYHQRLYYRNILYTCVTRAKKLMIILGSPETVSRMIANHRKVLRYTNLAFFASQSLSTVEPGPLPEAPVDEDDEDGDERDSMMDDDWDDII
jgi:exodeoxyribonuclease V alpha subunit